MSNSAGRSISHLQAWVKWLAVASMVIDHVGLVLFPEVVGLRVVGRFAFPAFAGLVGYNVAARGVPVMRYLKPMAIFGIVSQLPFMLTGSGGFNIFFTLGLGVVLFGVRTGQLPRWWLVAVAGAPFVDYATFGVLLVYVAAEYVRSPRLWLGVAWLACVGLAQGSVPWGVTAQLVVLLAGALMSMVVVVVGGVPAVPRGPRRLFYWVYPAHLAVLVAIGLVL